MRAIHLCRSLERPRQESARCAYLARGAAPGFEGSRSELQLDPVQQAIIQTDFGMLDGRLVVPSRRALVKYVLQRYQIDPRNVAPSPEAQQIVVTNLKELRPWLMND